MYRGHLRACACVCPPAGFFFWSRKEGYVRLGSALGSTWVLSGCGIKGLVGFGLADGFEEPLELSYGSVW